jgi:oligopeptide/dipeptide ABC transporter ATP-binding protein
LSILEAQALRKTYRLSPLRGHVLHAVDGVDCAFEAGEVAGVVGESGSGKSTLARLLLRLQEPSSGRVLFDGRDINALPAPELRALRRQMQIVLQDPYSTLDPRIRVEESLLEPLVIHGLLPGRRERDAWIDATLASVGLRAEHRSRFPAELSGGQCQRLSIARALALQPRLLVLDEPTAALDVSVQAQLIALLERLRSEREITFLFISHDLALMRYFCERVLVVYRGRIVESMPTSARPRHHYTRFLFDSAPTLDTSRKRVRPVERPARSAEVAHAAGCAYAARCPAALAVCAERVPAPTAAAPDHQFACHNPLP